MRKNELIERKAPRYGAHVGSVLRGWWIEDSGQELEVLLVERLKAGAYGKLFVGRVVNPPPLESMRVVVKLPNIRGTLERAAMTRRIDRLTKSLENEARTWRNLKGLKCTAAVVGYGSYAASKSYRLPYLVQQYVDGRELGDHFKSPGKRFSGVRTAGEWAAWATKLTEAVTAAHKRLVVHGDIWPSNIMVGSALGNPVILIDFGQALLLSEEFGAAGRDGRNRQAYMAPERSSSKNTWSEVSDMYSVGATLFYIATGAPPDIEKLRRASDDDLQSIMSQALRRGNPRLHDENPGIARIIGRCLRSDPSIRTSHGESLLFDIATFFPKTNATAKTVRKEVRKIRGSLGAIGKRDENIYEFIAQVRLEAVRRDVESLAGGAFLLTGTHDAIAGTWSRFLSVLATDDEYVTVSVPAIWYPWNLGIDGRYMAVQETIVRNGARIRRILMVSYEEVENDVLRSVLKAHAEFSVRLATKARSSDASITVEPEVSVVLMSAHERDQKRASGHHFALWRKGRVSPEKFRQQVLIVPMYATGEAVGGGGKYQRRSAAGVLSRYQAYGDGMPRLYGVRFLDCRHGSELIYLEQYHELVARAVPIVDFVKKWMPSEKSGRRRS